MLDYPNTITVGKNSMKINYKKVNGLSSSVRIHKAQVQVSISNFLIGRRRDKTVLKFISASLTKCSVGEVLKLKTWNTWGTFFDTPDLCNASSRKIAAGFVNHFTALGIKNPYVNINHPYSTVVENPTTCQDAELGYTCIIVSDVKIKIQTEWKNNEYLQDEFQRE